MNNRTKLFGNLADLVYDTPKTRTLNLQKLAKMFEVRMENHYNGKKMMVISAPDLKELYLVHRGTADAEDVAVDAVVFLSGGRATNRYKEDKRTTLKFAPIFPDFKFIHIGHSLGGWVARTVAHDLGQQSVVFNPFSPPRDALANQFQERSTYAGDGHQHESHIVTNDPIGMSDFAPFKSAHTKRYYYHGERHASNPHTIKNFV